MTGPPLVEFIDVSVRRRGEELLAGISLAVAHESIHLIVGPNGAGKTTLLGSLLGQVAFDGRIIAHWRGSGRIGYVPQSFAVDPSLPVTVEDFLALTRQRRPVCLGIGPATRRRLAELLREVLSGGELRRVLLAHALDPVPELLVLDEPGSGLDEAGVRQLEDLLLALRSGGTTIVMVSHDLDQVRRLADRVTVLDRSIVTEGPPDVALSLDVQALLPTERARKLRAER
jgi:zinc transport system ATP-binding protein